MSVDFRPNVSDDKAPWLNVSNFNVSVVLDIMGYQWESDKSIYCGKIEHSRLKNYLKNVLSTKLAGMERETNIVGNWTFCGLPLERLQEYRQSLIEIIAYCMAHDVDLVWY